jgi:glycerol kinase
MNKDSGVELKKLKADGGMVANNLLMQFQADILDVPVVRPKVAETTCLGAAYAAGIASGYWSGREDLYNNWEEDITWYPDMAKKIRNKGYAGWKKAVTRTLDWEA